ncbi:MAG: SOS response-associated peptidase [Rhizobiaceae bacterium]|nr:SOS response-associated peptidase [Rhizobiaceae bacterium]
MCGRYALDATAEEIAAFLGVIDIDLLVARFNIPPTEPIVLAIAGHPRAPGSNLPGRRSLLVRWGLIPAWAKNPKDMPLLINARAETAAEKNAFKAAMRHRRALIPASGFYEWKRVNGRPAQAYWVRPRKGGLVAFAGLMETWAEPGGSEIDTGAILTTQATGEVATIHDRMPLVIRPEDFDRWLDCRTQEPRDVADLLRPVEPDFFEAIPVSDKVNKVANTGADVQQRVEPVTADQPKPEKSPPASAQLNLF